MNRHTNIGACLLLLAGLSTGCASIQESLVSAPGVELTDVQVLDLGFKSQTFLLSFDVSNPNSFVLPISHVDYGVKLDGQRFASGETASNFTIPANGIGQFAIRVDVNLLQTAPQLLPLFSAGSRQDIPYQLEGRFSVEVPLLPTVRYVHEGSIRLGTNVADALSLR